MAQGMTIAQLSPGMTAELSHTVTEADIQGFARVTGDTNPVHMDEAYAQASMFKGRIAHGMLSAGFISAVLGTKLPGPGAIYMSQSMFFKAPVRIGDTVVTRVTVKEVIADKKRVKLDTVCLVNDKPVLEGEALLMVPAA
jgi:3-hydroxybutyryl-CoA dehydratase